MDDWQDKLKAMLESMPADEGQQTQSEPEPLPAKKDGKKEKLGIAYEKKGRNGKPVTIVYGFKCDAGELARIASMLKKRLACGGSADAGEILIQGDRQKDVRDILIKEGYKF